MQELIKLVSKKTGLSEELSKVAVDVVLDYLKKKLPAPVAVQVEAVLSGEGNLGAAANVIGGLLGGKKS
jgi:hypothetical protein